MTEYTINPQQWFVNRRLPYEPVHFVKTNIRLTKESYEYLINNFTGRYSIRPYHYEDGEEDILSIFNYGEEYLNMVPSFEDPGEAMMFTLKWS